ncbi:MAG: hypothetical protein RLY92_880 [Chloroflexota bacterium]
MILWDAVIRVVRAPHLCKALRCSVKADKCALLIALQCGQLRCGWAGARTCLSQETMRGFVAVAEALEKRHG